MLRRNTFLISIAAMSLGASGAQAQTSIENPFVSEHASRCFDRKSYAEDQVEICMACDGRILVNGVPVALQDMDKLFSQLKTVPKQLRYKVTAKTDVELGAYLGLQKLLEKHEIVPDYRIALASRRSLCR